MSKVQTDFLKVINDSVTETIYSLGQKILFEAKSTVPVKTGNLKATGTISKIPGGFKITFGGPAAPYGGIIEGGREATPYDNTPYTYSIKRHKRKAPGKVAVKAYTRGGGTVKAHRRGGQTNVQAHTVTLTGQRRVPVNGDFITTSMMPAIKATHFLKNSLEKVLANELGKQLGTILPKKMTIKV